jgi:hypothetical protein
MKTKYYEPPLPGYDSITNWKTNNLKNSNINFDENKVIVVPKKIYTTLYDYIENEDEYI